MTTVPVCTGSSSCENCRGRGWSVCQSSGKCHNRSFNHVYPLQHTFHSHVT